MHHVRTTTTFFTDHWPLLLFDNDFMSEITPGLERTRGTLLHSRELSHAKSRLGKSTSHVYHVLSSIRLLLHWDTIPRYDTIWMRSHIIIKPWGSWQEWVSTKCSISRRHFNNNNDDVTWNRGVRDRRSHAGGENELRQNPRSHSWRFNIYNNLT